MDRDNGARPEDQKGQELGPGGVPLEPAGAAVARRRASAMDYYLGTREGRARLLIMILVLSMIFTGVGYALIFWIFMRGGM